MAIELHTGMVPGRIVWGNPAKAQIKKDQQTKQPVLRDGQPVQQWAFGVAFPKDYFEAHIWPALAQEAAAGYPNGTPRNFSFKYVDGDGVDNKGQPYSTREGYAGCYVLTISTEAFAPPIYKRNAQGMFDQVPVEGIKTGDYVALGLTIKVNVPTNPTHTPGLYINPIAIELVGYGTEIHSVGAVDPNALFGGHQYQLPAGASTTPPVTAGAVAMPGMAAPMAAPAPMQQAPAAAPGMAAPGMMPGAAPMAAPAPVPAAAPGMMPPPAHDFVQNAGQMPGAAPAAVPGMMPGIPGMGR